MLPLAVNMYSIVKQAHEEATTSITELKRAVPALSNSDTELADLAYALKKMEEFADDIRKQCKALGKTVQTAACVTFIKNHAADDPNAETTDTIKTEYCTARPDVLHVATVPSRKTDPEGYKKFCEFFKLDPALIGDEETPGAISINWQGMIELLTERASQGLPLPPGCDPSKTYPMYRLSPIRKRKEVDAV
jgi:hypothetical protein